MSSLLFLWSLLVLSGCAQDDRLRAHLFSGSTMGTTYSVRVVLPAAVDIPADLDEEIERWLAEINQSMSTYIDDSELMQLNRAPTGRWLPISEMMAEVLAEAQDISLLSGGAFDITVGPLVDLWGFGPVEAPELPTEEQIQHARERVGFQHVMLSLQPPAIRKDAPVQIDLSAIAKGFGADYVGRQLEELDVDNYLVEIGGELAVKGYNQNGDLWRIGVERPNQDGKQVQETISLDSGGIATSGDYRNFYERGGQIYTHILDPRQGRPVKTALVSVTVVAETAARADGLATAMIVMDSDEALAMAEKEGIAAYLISRSDTGFVVRQSSAMVQYVSLTRD